MPLQQNSALNVLETLKELEQKIGELRASVEASIRRSERRYMFGAHCYVHFDKAKIQDQIPKGYENSPNLNAGNVVAVDYRTKKVTVNCGSVTDYHTGEEVWFEFELSIFDVYVPKEYESETEDSQGPNYTSD